MGFEEQDYGRKKNLVRTHIKSEDKSGADIIYWNAVTPLSQEIGPSLKYIEQTKPISYRHSYILNQQWPYGIWCVGEILLWQT